MMRAPQFVSARDLHLLIGQVLEGGSICYNYVPRKRAFFAVKSVFMYGNRTDTTFDDYDYLKKDVKEVLQLDMPDYSDLMTEEHLKYKVEDANVR
jgi:hypothetical protein